VAAQLDENARGQPHHRVTGDVPGLYLRLGALEANIEVLQEWCIASSLELAPHIKTTMTPAIVQRQLAAGGWGVTVATVRQAELGARWGATRVILANEVVDPAQVGRLSQLAAAPHGPETYVFVDSAAGAHAAADAGPAGGEPQRPLRLLIDVGVRGGRTGVRTAEEAIDLAHLVHDLPGVHLAGVAGYEGVRPNSRDADTLAEVRAHCDTSIDLLERVRPLVETGDPLFTMGGSAFPDCVADAIHRHRAGGARPFTAVVRSGCYVTHDHGTYAGVSPFPALQPALHVRATIISRPEPGWAVVGAGRRELPYDAGLPVLLGARSPDGAPRAHARGTSTRIFDHHLVLTDAADLDLGDVVELGISHPCSAFDRWPTLTVLDDDGDPVDSWPIEFH